MDLNRGGQWPALLDTPDGPVEVAEFIRVDFVGRRRESEHDLAEGMPERQDSIAPETLGAMIIATGVMVVVIGCSLLWSQGVQLGFAFGCGVVVSLVLDRFYR